MHYWYILEILIKRHENYLPIYLFIRIPPDTKVIPPGTVFWIVEFSDYEKSFTLLMA